MLAVQLQYHISKDDYAVFYNHTLWSSGKKKKAMYLSIAKQLGTAIFYILIYIYAFKGSFSSKYAFAFIAVYVVMILLSIFNNKNEIDKQLASFLDNTENGNIFTSYNTSFNENEIHTKTDLTESKTKWPAIINKVETDTHYFLYENTAYAIIIPKRAFINNDQKNTFDKILLGTLTLTVQLNDELNNAAK